jgi:hypothetical protein
MKSSHIGVAFLMFFLLIPITKAVTSITDCTDLTSNGTYYVLTTDLINKTGLYESDKDRYSCIRLHADNIIFDCQNHLVSGLCEYGHHGIRLSGSNDTLKNCFLSNWDVALVNDWYASYNLMTHITILSSDSNIISGGDFAIFDNIDVRNNWVNCGGYGYSVIDIYATYPPPVGSQVIVRNSIFNLRHPNALFWFTGSACSIYGNVFNVQTLWIDTYLPPNYLSPILFYNNLVNVSSLSLTNNISLNTTRQTGSRVYSSGINIGGNYWTNSSGDGYSDTCSDTVGDGFCDSPFIIDGSHIDYLPYSTHYSPPPVETGVCRVCEPSTIDNTGLKLLCLLGNLIFCNTILFAIILIVILGYLGYRKLKRL